MQNKSRFILISRPSVQMNHRPASCVFLNCNTATLQRRGTMRAEAGVWSWYSTSAKLRPLTFAHWHTLLHRIFRCTCSVSATPARLDSEIQPSGCGSPVACGRVKHSVSYNSTSAPNPQALCWGYGRSASDSTLP